MSRQDVDSGFALPSVLWFVLLLSVMAASVSVLARSELKLVGSEEKLVADAATAEAGLNISIARLLSTDTNIRWSEFGSPYAIQFHDRSVKIEIGNELGKIDLNSVSDELLVELFKVAGLEAEIAVSLKDRVRDWRDKNQLVHLNGAERDDYYQAEMAFEPRDNLFETSSELSQVLGIEKWLIECLSNEITVHSGRSQINPYAAGPLARRAAGAALNEPSKKQHSNTSSVRSNVSGKVLSIRAVSGSVSAQLTVRFTGDTNDPYWILAKNNEPLQNKKCIVSPEA